MPQARGSDLHQDYPRAAAGRQGTFVGTWAGQSMVLLYEIAEKYVPKGLPHTDGLEPSIMHSHSALKSVPCACGLKSSE